jgi:hypothetical protein
MIAALRQSRFGLIALAALAAACADATLPSEPAAEAPRVAHSILDAGGGILRAAVDGNQGHTLLTWRSTLNQDLTVTQPCDRRTTCVITLPSVGTEVVIPEGALKRNTEISVTALAGQFVNFEFAPHGLKFKMPIAVSVNMRGTSADYEGMTTQYWSLFWVDGLEDVREEIVAWLVGDTLFFLTDHFSGYAIASDE